MNNNDSGASSVNSGGRERRRNAGVPKRCWCGEAIIAKMSKSESNPYRRYYRCAFAIEKSHIFKWVDDALLSEIEALTVRTEKLEQVVADFTNGTMEVAKKMFEELQMKLENESDQRVEEAVAEAKNEMKKMMLVICLGCIVVVGCTKLVG
ncbi:uncharacterized protein At4g04775-like [Eutrema salsugineum]|uniref:uncharacterized protein At4g04775-like n=1 Tax=Eutrema salsugineum TaxID=72664 RepID=UPI000CED0274|nr:uncharacterized protein At4g04775-like [Eutrema salsugineum]